MFQSRGYCSKDVMTPWKLVSLSSSVMLSQALSDSQPVQGLSIWFSRSITCVTIMLTVSIILLVFDFFGGWGAYITSILI